jgi:SWI/SNF-related matrix-associated actin-dependent regulator of chromatin subfamily A protein 2/4
MFMESVPEAPPEAIAAAQPPLSERGSAPPDKLYADSIESLIRNTIQKMKIDMANEVIDAGRFDGQTTNEERKQTLESLLQDEVRSNPIRP